jgi:hypothetical protein
VPVDLVREDFGREVERGDIRDSERYLAAQRENDDGRDDVTEEALTHQVKADSLVNFEETLYTIVINLVNSFEYRLAFDLIRASFRDEIPNRFVVQMDKASEKDIEQTRKEAADLYLEARNLESSQPNESLYLMRESLSLLDDLLNRYPHHDKTEVIQSNRESIIERMDTIEEERFKGEFPE